MKRPPKRPFSTSSMMKRVEGFSRSTYLNACSSIIYCSCYSIWLTARKSNDCVALITFCVIVYQISFFNSVIVINLPWNMECLISRYITTILTWADTPIDWAMKFKKPVVGCSVSHWFIMVCPCFRICKKNFGTPKSLIASNIIVWSNDWI